MPFSRLLLALALVAGAFPALSAEPVGVKKISVVSDDWPRALAVTVWYPSAPDGTAATIGENKIFEGVPARLDATIRPGHLPLILLSHGSGSRVEGMDWIATRLAEAGFIVAGPNHPGTTSGDSTPAATLKIWERTQDLSTIITALLADPRWKGAIDPGRIGVLGFSLGGTTALELAGARADLDGYIRYCRDHADMMDCHWLGGDHGFADGEQVAVTPLDLGRLNRTYFEQSNRDSRIAAVLAVDPGLAAAFKPDSLKAIDIPVSFINLGSPGSIPAAVLSDGIARQVPGASYRQVDQANHFSYLPVCKPSAAALLASVGEPDPICTETPRPRADIHAELERLTVDAFQRMLKTGK